MAAAAAAAVLAASSAVGGGPVGVAAPAVEAEEGAALRSQGKNSKKQSQDSLSYNLELRFR